MYQQCPKWSGVCTHTALRSRDAVTLGVPIKCRREEYVSHMALRRGNAASKDVRSKIKREEFVSHMAHQRWRVNDATSRGVPHIPGGKEESVSRMELRWRKRCSFEGCTNGAKEGRSMLHSSLKKVSTQTKTFQRYSQTLMSTAISPHNSINEKNRSCFLSELFQTHST